jgi:hypothetical protein
MRVVFVVIDALPNHWVGPRWTPHLWRLIATGGHHPEGGRAVWSTATYPNHATFATGRTPREHGILVNRVWDGTGFVASSGVGPRGATIFDAASAAGRSTSIVVGDHHLIGVMGGGAADRHWPPDGRRADVALDEFRYAADTAVLDAVDRTDALAADLAVIHFNEPDTACHLHGPDAPETGERIRATDGALGALLDRLGPHWDDTAVIVVSDHDQEEVTGYDIDLVAELAGAGLPGVVETEGTAALVRDGPGPDRLTTLPSVDGAIPLDEHHTLVWGEPGRVFGPWLAELHGSHGSPRCDRQVAAVGGGHPAVAALADRILRARPRATEWAGHIAHLLDMPPP